MIFQETALKGAFLIDLEIKEDVRGFFARTWCAEEFAAQGLDPRLVQCSLSFNRTKGTLRGMHFQSAPHQEAKLVRCTTGAIFDVIIDLRPTSLTYTKHLGMVLTADSRQMLYIPEGMAHGFQTLADYTEVFYQMSHRYEGGSARGVRWNDPLFGISWPLDNRIIISERDQQYPDFVPERNRP